MLSDSLQAHTPEALKGNGNGQAGPITRAEDRP